MDIEEVRASVDERITYWSIPPMNLSLMLNYPELDYRSWAAIAYIKRFLDANKMTFIEYQGERYYWVSYSHSIPSLWIHGIRYRQKMASIMQGLSGKGGDVGKEYFFKSRTVRKQDGTYTYYCPTETYYALWETDKVVETAPKTPTPDPDDDEKYTFSSHFSEFRDTLLGLSNRFSHHGDPVKKDGTVLKLWEKTDKYLCALLDGTFTEKFKLKKDVVVPKLSIVQIAELCDRCKMATERPCIDQAFIDHTGQSPILNYYYKTMPETPPELPPGQFEGYQSQYSYLWDSSTSFGITSLRDKLPGLTEHNPLVYDLHNKIMTYFDDDRLEDINVYNLNKIVRGNVKLFIGEFLRMCIERSGYKTESRKTFNDWYVDTKVGKYDVGSWFVFVMWMYEKKKFWITDNTTVQAKVKEILKKKQERKSNSSEY